MIFHSDVPQHPVMGPALVWLPEGRCSDLPSSRWAVPGHAPASAEAEHGGGAGPLSPEPSCLVLEAGPGAGGTASEGSKRPSPPLRWPRWWFWSLAPPQIGYVSPGCGTSALAGGLAGGAWESPALPQSGLRMAKGQALMAFPTGKCPPTEWYFPRATFREGRVASGSESPSLRPRPAALSVTRRFNAAPRSCCVQWGKRFGLMSSLRFKGT